MSIDLLFKLLSPLNYLRIKHEAKSVVDWQLPLVVAAALTLLIWLLPKPISIAGPEGFIFQVNGLLQVLTGFYIAALAAVSTFQSETMDEQMAGDPPTLLERRRGRKKPVNLIRRRFLCYLFGYLAFISFGLFSLGLLVNLIVPAVALEARIGSTAYLWLRYGFLFAYFLALANLAASTLLGLYYLTVRIHIKEPERIGANEDDSAEASSSD